MVAAVCSSAVSSRWWLIPKRKTVTIAMSPTAVRAICQPTALFFPTRGSVTKGRFRIGSFSGEFIVTDSRKQRSGAATPERLSSANYFDSYFAPPCDGAGLGAVGAAGAIGFGEVEPEPVVLGAVLPVVAVGDEPVLAVLLLLFQPAMIRKPISSRTATPAIQPHIPPAALSSRRSTGSLNRGSLYRGSVKRGSVMTSSFHSDAIVSNGRNPRAVPAVPLTSA